jgi:hypothetical protein
MMVPPILPRRPFGRPKVRIKTLCRRLISQALANQRQEQFVALELDKGGPNSLNVVPSHWSRLHRGTTSLTGAVRELRDRLAGAGVDVQVRDHDIERWRNHPGFFSNFGSEGSMKAQGCTELTQIFAVGRNQLGSSRLPGFIAIIS